MADIYTAVKTMSMFVQQHNCEGQRIIGTGKVKLIIGLSTMTMCHQLL